MSGIDARFTGGRLTVSRLDGTDFVVTLTIPSTATFTATTPTITVESLTLPGSTAHVGDTWRLAVTDSGEVGVATHPGALDLAERRRHRRSRRASSALSGWSAYSSGVTIVVTRFSTDAFGFTLEVAADSAVGDEQDAATVDLSGTPVFHDVWNLDATPTSGTHGSRLVRRPVELRASTGSPPT